MVLAEMLDDNLIVRKKKRLRKTRKKKGKRRLKGSKREKKGSPASNVVPSGSPLRKKDKHEESGFSRLKSCVIGGQKRSTFCFGGQRILSLKNAEISPV